ncbi:hypothetical protein N7470_007597 [Penicillium chermesinum]|nr:hypothetical protein N7470_007597 [Penicillium chermesinum]
MSVDHLSHLVTVTYQDRIAIVTINRPEKLNALDSDLYYLLGERLREVDERDDIYITVLTGTGRFFSAGADVTSARPEGDPSGRAQWPSRWPFCCASGPRRLYLRRSHAFILTPFASLGLVAEGGASRAFVERLGISKANEALIMSKRIPIEDLVSTGFVNKVITADSKKPEDSAGFLKNVLVEVEDRLGTHLNQSSLVKIKELIRRPEREILDRQNTLEAFVGIERFMTGGPQEEFRKLASGEKKHKL